MATDKLLKSVREQGPNKVGRMAIAAFSWLFKKAASSNMHHSLHCALRVCACVFLFLHTAWATRVAGGRLSGAKAPGHKAKGNTLAMQSQPCAELKSKAQTIPKVQKMRKRT